MSGGHGGDLLLRTMPRGPVFCPWAEPKQPKGIRETPPATRHSRVLEPSLHHDPVLRRHEVSRIITIRQVAE